MKNGKDFSKRLCGVFAPVHEYMTFFLGFHGPFHFLCPLLPPSVCQPFWRNAHVVSGMANSSVMLLWNQLNWRICCNSLLWVYSWYSLSPAAQSNRAGKRGPFAIIKNVRDCVRSTYIEMENTKGQSKPSQTFRGGNGIVLFAGYCLFKTGLKKAYIPMCQKETIETVYHRVDREL